MRIEEVDDDGCITMTCPTIHMSMRIVEHNGYKFQALYHSVEGENIPRFDKLAIDVDDIGTERREAAIRYLMETYVVSECFATNLVHKWLFEAVKQRNARKEGVAE